MQYNQDELGAMDWSSAEVTELAEAAERLHRLARPLLYEAMHAQALLRTVREFPPNTPLGDLARAMAENALRRALRAGDPARTVGVDTTQPRFTFAYNLALAELTEDATRDLRGVAHVRRAGGWDG